MVVNKKQKVTYTAAALNLRPLIVIGCIFASLFAVHCPVGISSADCGQFAADQSRGCTDEARASIFPKKTSVPILDLIAAVEASIIDERVVRISAF